MKNWNNEEVICIDKTTGKKVEVGSHVVSFRGEVHTVKHLEPPHKPSASGRIYTEENFGGGLYCGVFNCTFTSNLKI